MRALVAVSLALCVGGVSAQGDLRRIPGERSDPQEATSSSDPNRNNGLQAVAPVLHHAGESIPVPDRWRLLNDMGLIPAQIWDPYAQNVLKADMPVHDDWFVSVTAISDSIYEARRLPTPVGPQTSSDAGALDIFGDPVQDTIAQSLILSLAYLKGNTTFRPPDWEFRLTPVFNYNNSKTGEVRATRIDPRRGERRRDEHVGLQDAFVDYHIRNVSDHYDFDSIRIGIQPINLDFRGFLFQDNPLAVRLFGIRDNNIFQYNALWARRLEKDTNSGLNDVGESPRDDDLFAINVYWQDMPSLGYFSQFTLAHNRNREDGEFFFDNNGFIARPSSLGNESPRHYDVSYLGYNGDGHFGRMNVTAASYAAFGDQSRGVFTDSKQKIAAYFAALELSIDYSWWRLRMSGLWASGDDDPFDDTDSGFDAVFENPIFAGADTSFWIRQAVPLVGGGGVALSTRNGVLNNLRSSKEHGQSNFNNPGTVLLGVGADFELTPTTRLSANVNQLWFENTDTLELARNQANIDKQIGTDVSLALIWRPFMSQNLILRASAASLLPQRGFKDLFDVSNPYSVLINLVVAY